MSRDVNYEYFTVELKANPPHKDAILVLYEGDEVWLPRSQIDFHLVRPTPAVGDEFDLGVADWIARDRGMVD